MPLLMNLLVPVAADWRMIGVQLGFHPSIFRNIIALSPGATVEDKLLALLSRWLGSHEAKLSQLVEALRSDAVSKRVLALNIEYSFLSQRTHSRSQAVGEFMLFACAMYIW